MATLRQNKKYHILLFILSPILGLIYGLRTKSQSYIRWSIFFFTVIYGSVFHISFLGDGAVHWENVYNHYQYLQFGQFWEELIAIITFEPLNGTNDDVYIHVMSYLVGNVFNIPRFFFVPISIVYAYFYSGTLVKVLSYVNWNTKYNRYFFLFFLIILILPALPNIQFIRSTTGLWVLLYSIISYHQTKKKKYLFLALAPVLIHVGYLVLALPIWIVLFSGYRNPKLYFIIFMISVLASNVVSQTGVNELASQTEVGASKVRGYTQDQDEEAISAKNKKKLEYAAESNQRFYRTFQAFRVQNYIYAGMAIFIYVFLSRRGFGAIENTLFSYGLATGSLANFLAFNFAIYNRGWGIAEFLILSLMLIFLSKQNLKNIPFASIKIKFPLFLFSIGLVPLMFYLISQLLSFTSPFVIMLPIINWIVYDMGTNLRALIGILL